jgi:hypothetical protein
VRVQYISSSGGFNLSRETRDVETNFGKERRSMTAPNSDKGTTVLSFGKTSDAPLEGSALHQEIECSIISMRFQECQLAHAFPSQKPATTRAPTKPTAF